MAGRSHTKDQRPNLKGHRFAPTDLPGPGEPFPIKAEASSMPVRHWQGGADYAWLEKYGVQSRFFVLENIRERTPQG